MRVKELVQRCWQRIRFYVMGLGLLFTVFVLFFWNDIAITVHSGELGVKYTRFWGGTKLDKPLDEGLYFIWPFDIIYCYNMRIIEQSEDVTTLTSAGLPVTVSISCQYQINADRLPLLHQQVGPNYQEKIILPMMRSVTRQVVGIYTSDSLYTSARQELEDIMMVKAVAAIGRLPITIHNFVIKNITLPEEVKNAIIAKTVAKQRYDTFEYILLAEKEEAKRKNIEAQGIQDFQKAVNAGLTENYLRYEGIKATLALAKSNNTKVVLAGGKDGLPIMLNLDDASSSKATAPSVSDASAPASHDTQATQTSGLSKGLPGAPTAPQTAGTTDILTDSLQDSPQDAPEAPSGAVKGTLGAANPSATLRQNNAEARANAFTTHLFPEPVMAERPSASANRLSLDNFSILPNYLQNLAGFLTAPSPQNGTEGNKK